MKYFAEEATPNFEMPADVGSTDCPNIYVRVRGTRSRLGGCVQRVRGTATTVPHTHNFLKEEFKHDTYIFWPMLASHTWQCNHNHSLYYFFYEYSPVQRERRSPSNV